MRVDNGTQGSNTSSDTEDQYFYDYDINESFTTFDWSELGPSLFVYTVTFVLGIVGNTLILAAVIRNTHIKSSPVNVRCSRRSTRCPSISVCTTSSKWVGFPMWGVHTLERLI